MARWLHLPNNTVPLGIPEPNLTIQSDASRSGIGFMINSAKYHLSLDKSMKDYSINVLELLAIWMATLMIHQRNIILRILTDNSAALSAINKASSGAYLLASITEMIWKRASVMKWTISAAHIKGSFNVVADQLSRNTTISTEWSLPRQVFKREVLRHEPRLEVDLFATSLNHQLKEYVSPCPDQKAEAINALNVDWGRWDHLYLFPPRPLILKALQKLKQSNIKTALFLTMDKQFQKWYRPLKSQLTPISTFEVKLQQVVVDRLETEKKTSRIRVWKFSEQQMAQNSPDVTN